MSEERPEDIQEVDAEETAPAEEQAEVLDLAAQEADSTSAEAEANEDETVETMEEVVEVVEEIVPETIEEEVVETAEEVIEEKTAPVVAAPKDVDDGREWYVVHCYSGQENKVRHNLEQRIDSMEMKDFIFDVVVPTEEEIEVKDGKRRTIERRVFPGYVIVNMLLTEESWYVVRNTPGVTGFVGMGNDPTPLRPEEVTQIIKRMEADAPRIKVTFRSGERVRIIDGPFNDFHGVVDEIDMDRAKVRVLVNFFGRETPVELDFLQVDKA